MAIYTEKVKDKTTGKMVDKKVDGKTQYYIRTYVTDEFGKKKQITRHNKEWLGRDGYWKAQQEENRLRDNFVYIEEVIPNKQKEIITLKELEEDYLTYLKGKIDDDTLTKKRMMLDHFCEVDKTNQVKTIPNAKLIKFDKKIYEFWQKEMRNKIYNRGRFQKKFTLDYLNKIHNEICRMLDFAITEGYCKINFARQVGKFGTLKEIRMSSIARDYITITYNEYLSLLEASENDLRYNTYFDLAFSRGPRTGEVRAFKIKDYNPIKKQLMVNHTLSKSNILKEPKTASSKAPIDLDDEVDYKINKLINYWRQFDNFNNDWYIFGGETPISSNALVHAKNKYFKIAGIEKHLRLHDFRHSCATWLHSIGVPAIVVYKILRHANVNETLKTYTHLFNEDYTENLNAINNYKLKNKTKNKTKTI